MNASDVAVVLLLLNCALFLVIYLSVKLWFLMTVDNYEDK